MDIGIFNIFAILAIFLPLFFGLFLLISRLRLSFVDKNVLNYGCIVSNFASLILFIASYFALNKEIISYSFNLFSFEDFTVSFGFLFNSLSEMFLIFASLMFFLISFFSKKYFDKKRNFIFTKQRYFAYLAILSSLTYFLITSHNLLQSAIILIIQGILIFCFSYIDIFKTSLNLNAIRFQRITNIGNFALFAVVLILFRYAIFSQGYVESNSLFYGDFEALLDYTYGISTNFEFAFLCTCAFAAISSRLAIFPFSCYYSFFANSSSIFYLSVFACVNNIAGMFLLLKFLPMFEILEDYAFYFQIFLGVALLFSLLQILFEQNIKIIFGYLISALNCGFVILFLNFNQEKILCFYFVLCLILSAFLANLFMKDKNNISRRIINIKSGFVLEKSHIIFFENVFDKISHIAEILFEKIVENIVPFVLFAFDFVISLFARKTIKSNYFKNVRNILIIFALVALFAIFIALFGGFG